MTTYTKHKAPLLEKRCKAVAQEKFLEALAIHGVHTTAAKMAGVGLSTTKAWRKDPAFELRCDEALEEAADEAENELRRRAIHGAPQQLTYKGQLMYERDPASGELLLDDDFKPIPIWVNQKSDRLLEVLVKALKASYRDKRAVEVSGPNGKPLATSNLTEDEIDKRLAQYGFAAPLEE